MTDIEYVVVMHDGSKATKFIPDADYVDLMEQLAAAQSQEVCTVAHDNVETCGYCQRDALAARLALATALLHDWCEQWGDGMHPDGDLIDATDAFLRPADSASPNREDEAHG